MDFHRFFEQKTHYLEQKIGISVIFKSEIAFSTVFRTKIRILAVFELKMAISAAFGTKINQDLGGFDFKMSSIFDQKTCFLAVFDSKNWLKLSKK